jgi:hypothetical protein
MNITNNIVEQDTYEPELPVSEDELVTSKPKVLTMREQQKIAQGKKV